MTYFNTIGLPQSLVDRLTEIGFTEPTPIQARAIPVALEGKDILGSAQTGTGKTGAFGIPLVVKLLEDPRSTALVLLPTRELAMQVMQAVKQFIGKERIPTALLIGGEAMPAQIQQLRQRPRLVVGTPGRVNDHLGRGTLQLHQTRFLVLDEVDRMLDMGFGIQLEAIAKFLTNERQTLMFSATMPNNIKSLSAQYLTDPVRIAVGGANETSKNIKQSHVKVSEGEKYVQLLEELNTRQGSVIIFAKTKHGADRMAEKLRKAGHQAEAIHGDLRQNKRNHVIRGFREKRYRVLVATDVAARGLDIPHIEHVINYDLPQNPEDYIHRIGRTARAGAQGEAVAFLSPGDNGKWRAIQKLLDPANNSNAEGEEGGGYMQAPRPRKGGGKPSRAPFGKDKRRKEWNDERPARADKPRKERREESHDEKPWREERPERSERPRREERPERSEKPRREERGERSERSEGSKKEWRDKPRREERSDRPRKPKGEWRGSDERSERREKPFREERGDRPRKPRGEWQKKPRREGREERFDKPKKSWRDKPEREERGDRPKKPWNPERSERSDKPWNKDDRKGRPARDNSRRPDRRSDASEGGFGTPKRRSEPRSETASIILDAFSGFGKRKRPRVEGEGRGGGAPKKRWGGKR
jgi:ATP-dependent RNA helicase DeaD